MKRILCVHGVGHEEKQPQFESSWRAALGGAIGAAQPGVKVEISFLRYDAMFDAAGIGGADYVEAALRLLGSGIVHTVGDWFRRGRGEAGLPAQIRWTAGMVAQWVADEALRDALCQTLHGAVAESGADVVCAHSLGSLIAYDAFKRRPEAMHGRTLVTFGSQIGNPAVREVFGGRIDPIPGIGRWFHLFNPDDHVLTTGLKLADERFRQVLTPFDKPDDPLNHDAVWYLTRPETVATVWSELFPGRLSAAYGRQARGIAKALQRRPARRKPTDKALLVGINAYPRAEDRLEGCVNDVFLISSVLQESGFAPEDIRVVLDERATAAGIRERLGWLLDDTQPGDRRMFYYSGHGAQIPALNVRGEADRLDECLCPWDFDWNADTALSDNVFHDLYAELPYDSQFVAVFDCCHSGGMTREAGPRSRGLAPPDDIRHRMLRWSPELKMWVDRDWVAPMQRSAADAEQKQTAGNRHSLRRLGQANALRGTDDKVYDRRRRQYGHHGPYLPVLIHACRESQRSYEYRHGVTSYGAFTFAFAQILRELRERGENPSLKSLIRRVGERLRQLNYAQEPVLVGPKQVLGKGIPWR